MEGVAQPRSERAEFEHGQQNLARPVPGADAGERVRDGAARVACELSLGTNHEPIPLALKRQPSAIPGY